MQKDDALLAIAPYKRISVGTMTVVFVATMCDQIFDLVFLRLLAAAALIVFIANEWHGTARVGKLMIAIVTLVATLAWARAGVTPAVLLEAITRGAFFVSFFVATGLLQEAAVASPTMSACGEYFVHQPPARRYFMLSVGSHLCAVVLSLATLNLLAAVINKTNTMENAGGRTWVRDIRRRRMATALMRGVNTTVFWSPLSIALIVTHTSIGYGKVADFIPYGLVTAAVFLLWGWLIDVLSVPMDLRASVTPLRSRHHWTVLLRIVGIVAAIFIVAWSASIILGTTLLVAMLIVLPFLSFIWTLNCMPGARLRERFEQTATRFSKHVRERFPEYRAETSMVATAGALSVIVAGLVPADVIAALISATGLSGYGLLISMMLLVIALGQIAIVPLVSVSILASILPPPQTLGMSPEIIMLALVGAWALTVQSSVFTGLTLLTARLFDERPETVVYRWNLVYSCTGLLLLGAILAAGLMFR